MIKQSGYNHFLTILLICMAGALMTASCEKSLLKPDPPPTPMEVFEHLWKDIHNRYTYFELKGINWESTGDHYRSKITANMQDVDLFKVLGDMLYELQDGHVNLTSSFDRSRNWEWFQNYPDNYNQNIIDKYYLKKDYFITGPLHNQILDSVLYINYRSFTNKISQNHLEQLMDRAVNLKGVIIDIRHNGGGTLQNGNLLASCFTENKIVYARQRFKTGPGTNDFTTWEDLTIAPREGQRFAGPVVVLTNRRSYSAANFFAQMMRVVPNATLMGDNTGGGGGVPVYGELPNGWTYRFSASQAVNPDGDHLETSVPVDINVNMLSADERRGADTIIEAAIEHIQSQGL